MSVNWEMLAQLPEADLAKVDVAVMNIVSSAGLPGTRTAYAPLCLQTLDHWARKCRQFTNQMMPHFHAVRCDYPDSEPRFRIQAMVTHLQRDLGLKYHPGRKADDAPFHAADSFISEAVLGEGGTCASLPVVYVAIGRRLGYPLVLAATRGHLFCRWDASPHGERFNIEASGEGISFFPDEHYRTGRFRMPPETIKGCGFLESFSPREELASFLCERGECWIVEKNYSEATTAFAWANELDPKRGQYAFLVEQTVREWREKMRYRLPSRHFPMLDLTVPTGQFKQMPRELEREWVGLRVTDGLLKNEELVQRWWAPMRQNPKVRPDDLPERLSINYQWNKSKPN